MSTKTVLIRISGAIGLVILLTLALLIGSYFYNYSRDAAPEILGDLTLGPAEAPLGSPVSGVAALALPWHMSVASATVTPGKGSVEVNTPRIVKVKNSLGYGIYEVHFTIKSFSLGDIPAGQLVMELQNSRSETINPLSITMEIPPFKSIRATSGKTSLQLAGSMMEPQKPSYGWLWGLIVVVGTILLVIVVILIIRHRQVLEQAAPELPWVRARRRLNLLRTLIRRADDQELYNGFAELSDIIREYLEGRFSLRATRQTTDEFMTALGDYELPLSVAQRHSLRDFLASADLVKFAKASPDPILLENAVDKADELVVSTEPTEKEAVADKEVNHA